MKNFRLISFVLSIVFCLTLSAFGQETTGGIRGTVKDPNGAVVPNATVTAQNNQRTFTATADEQGAYEFAQIPPGMYVISATASGFGSTKRENVPVELGKTLQVNIDLAVAGSTAVVNVTSNEEPMVDVTSTQTATNISKQKIDLLPKTLRFDSVIQTAPGTRSESKSGGFQIDGASGSENRWIIDGLEVTRVFDGVLGTSKNIPFDFVNEVQVKSAGYEAEFGGATGGVINVATRSGSNSFHGEARLEMSLNSLAGNDRPGRRFDRLRAAAPVTPNAIQAAAGVQPRSFVPEYFTNPDGKDEFRSVAPAFDLGGPIWKDKLWFYGSYAPQFERTNRNIRLISQVNPGFQSTTGGPVQSVNGSITQLDKRSIEYKTKYDYMFGKIDFAPIKKLSFNFTGISTPTKVNGPTSNLAAETATVATFSDIRYPLKGGYAPSNQISGQGTWFATSNLVINGRIGRSYLNDKATNYDVPNSPLYSIATVCSFGAGCPTDALTVGSPNAFTSNSQTVYNITTRLSMSIDAAYSKRIFGQQHNIKGGYQRNRLANNILAGSAAGSIAIHYNENNPTCNCQGQFGWYQTNTSGQKGDVNSTNQGFFVQDSWQVHRRVTLNLGVRFENEFVPSFPLDASGHPGLDVSKLSVDPQAPIKFGWGDKIAPRIGGAWDVMGNGKLKVYGSYSVFYDTMKYNLSRGSFGGEVFVQTERKLDTLDFRSITLNNTPGALIIQRDLRVPALSNVPGPNGAVFHAVDPKIKPVREHEYTFGTDWEFMHNTVFSARYTAKKLDRTIEDIGLVFFAADGVTIQEQYMIGNPGFGTSVTDFQAFGFPPTAKAIRDYKGLELRLDKRFSHNWYANVSYTLSRLYGNYSGLSSSDETGRNAANTNRYFDMPWITYDAHGNLSNGVLATDRPNTVKLFGTYRFNSKLFGKKMETDISGSQFIYQGTPITSHVNIQIVGINDPNNPKDDLSNFVPSFINGRGDLGRTETFTQTDMLIRHRVRLSERASLLFQFNVINLFDEMNVTDRSGSVIKTSSATVSSGNEYNNPSTFATYSAPTFAQAVQLFIHNPGDWQTHLGKPLSAFDSANPFYNQASGFQGPRSARYSIGIQF